MSKIRDIYREIEPPKNRELMECPVCYSSAKLWEFSENEEDVVQRVVMCSNGDSFGPQDGMVNEGCLLYMPPDQFYRGRAADAITYWNEYAKALITGRSKRGYEIHKNNILRKNYV